MASVSHLMEGRTTLVITHNLTGLGHMDEILVMDKGRVVERGRHDQLLDKGGLYRKNVGTAKAGLDAPKGAI